MPSSARGRRAPLCRRRTGNDRLGLVAKETLVSPIGDVWSSPFEAGEAAHLA